MRSNSTRLSQLGGIKSLSKDVIKGMMDPIISAVGRLRHQFKASLGYIASLKSDWKKEERMEGKKGRREGGEQAGSKDF